MPDVFRRSANLLITLAAMSWLPGGTSAAVAQELRLEHFAAPSELVDAVAGDSTTRFFRSPPSNGSPGAVFRPGIQTWTLEDRDSSGPQLKTGLLVGGAVGAVAGFSVGLRYDNVMSDGKWRAGRGTLVGTLAGAAAGAALGALVVALID